MNYFIGWLSLQRDTAEMEKHFKTLNPEIDVDHLKADAITWLELFVKAPTNALERRFVKGEKTEVWHDTQIGLAQPLEIDIFGSKLKINGIAVGWAKD